MKTISSSLWHFDKNEKLISWGQTNLGRLTFFIIFSLGVFATLLPLKFALFFILSAALIAWYPAEKSLLLLVTGIVGLFLWAKIPARKFKADLYLHEPISNFRIFIFLSIIFLIFFLIQKFSKNSLLKHPLTFMIFLLFSIISITQLPYISAHIFTNIWIEISFIIPSFWIIAYCITNLSSKKPNNIFDNLCLFHPIFGFSFLPYGHIPYACGAKNIKKSERKNNESLSKAQLNAIKLLLIVLLCKIGKLSIRYFTKHYHIPDVSSCILAYQSSHPIERTLNLYSFILEFVEYLFVCGTWNFPICIARFSGFNLTAGTLNIFMSRDLADFWNRINFYFKELMVNFFFYPTFFKLSSCSDKTRILIATFMAAGVGNYLAHFITDIPLVYSVGLKTYIIGSSTYAFYSLLLAIGICISQLYINFGKNREHHYKFKFHVFLKIMIFFLLIHVFDDDLSNFFIREHGQVDLLTHFHYAGYLLGINN